MSPLTRSLRILVVACALLAVGAAGCSKKRGAPFDPDAGHPDDFFPTHPAEYRVANDSCTPCHGEDLMGGIAKVGCSLTSFEGRTCHPGGPGGHPANWRALHTATDPAQAATCASCHDNPSNTLPPNCFNNSLCHGQKTGHPDNWRSTHSQTNPAQAATCAACHDNPANTLPPNCFNGSLCHGGQSTHPAGWRSSHTGTDPAQAPGCAQCHDNPANTLPPNCFNGSLCHGSAGTHTSGWEASSSHGAAAKSAPGTMSGFAVCRNCHGGGFSGGTGPSCFPCHGWNAPHGRSGWDNGGSRHRSTNQANADVCAQCHRRNAGAAGCFNNTLCHGSDD